MKRPPNGFSLLEVMVAAAILTFVVALIYAALFSAGDTYANDSVHLALDERGREVLNQMVRELREAGVSTFVSGSPPAAIVAGTPYADVSFGRHSGLNLTTKQVEFGHTVRYRWVLDPAEIANGKDDNANGLVDEGLIEKTETFLGKPAVTTRICRDVKNQGLKFVLQNRSVAITLELERRDPKGTVVARKVETTAELRN